MAYIGLKQLDPILTGSLQVSGSAGFTGSLSLRAGDKLFTEADEGTYLQSDGTDRLRAVVGGNQMLLMDQDDGRVNIGYGQKLGVGLGNNTTPGVELEVDGDVSGSGLGSFGTVYAGTHITASGNISASGGEIIAKTVLLDNGIKYIDTGGDNRRAFNFPGSDVVAVTNRASNGVVQINANNATAGSAGEITVAQFNYSSSLFNTHITASGNISSSGTITAEQLTTSDDLEVGDQARIKTALVNPDAVSTGDFRVKSENLNHVLYTDANKDKVGIGWNDPAGSELLSSLHIDGDATLTHITASGNISGSSTSTGSFGRVETNVLEAKTLVISSSVTNVTIATSSGSTEFGDSADDTHTFTGHITASGNISSSGYIYGDGSNLTGITSGIFQTTGSVEATTNDLQVTGSLKVDTAATASTAIYTNNITNGYPTSNAWGESLEGSYFNNFDNTTHVSEILRFMAGAMSHSLNVADASPNTKYWNTLSTSHTEGSTTSKNSLLDGVLGSTYENARLSLAWTGSAFIDMSTTASYKAALDYLELKGWVQSSDRGTSKDDVGTNPFHGTYASRIPGTIQTQGTHGTNLHTITANAGGSSGVYSNSNYFGMGGLTSGGATPFYVRVLASHSFSDNYADSTPDENSTFTTASYVDYSISDFGTSNGLVLAKIVTAQPAVIPSAYQDGDFNSVAGPISGRFYTGGATSATSISASGYYATHDVVAGLKSGSQSDYVFKNGSDSNTRFYLYAGGLPSDITNSQPTAVVTSSAKITAYAATSRSLSGAPYLLTTTYTVTFDSEVSKSFDPCYGYASSPLVNSNTTDTWENIGSTTLSNTTVSVTNSGVQSTGANLYVIDSTKSTKRSSSGIPHLSDIAVASSSLSFTLDSNTENVGQNRTSNNTLNYSLVFRARSRNWKNTSVDSSSGTIYLWDAARFGQNSDSGSMAVYSRAQGYDSNTLQDLTESFTGEDFRIVLADNVQAFNGAYFTTDSFQTNDEGDSTLGQNDLQVKPGYLVDPTGSYGYWFTSDSLSASSAGYRYYIRRFEKSAGTKTSMTVDVGKTLVNWNATTSDSVAIALLLESSGNGSGNNSSLGTARIFDPSDLTSNSIETGIAQDNFKNPFTTAIDLYGNVGGSKSSTEYTVPIRNADGMYLDSNDNQLYVIIRYKGDPSPVTSITLSYS
jgi:hypothetical protein